MSDNTENEIVASFAVASMAQKMIDLTPVFVVPEGYKVAPADKFLLKPTRKIGASALRDAGSFIKYVTQEATKGSRIYGCVNPPGFKAVFNDNGAEGPGWRDHTASFDCPLSVEWKTWVAANAKQMTQENFARFIEDNLPDIAKPPAAEMLEISRSLEAKKKVDFAIGIRLSNGQNELTYTEEITGTAQKGKLTVPETFTIGIPVLEGGARYAVECRLRYRIGEGKMVMWYELVRPHKIIEDAVNDVWLQIQNATGVDILNGTP